MPPIIITDQRIGLRAGPLAAGSRPPGPSPELACKGVVGLGGGHAPTTTACAQQRGLSNILMSAISCGNRARAYTIL